MEIILKSVKTAMLTTLTNLVIPSPGTLQGPLGWL